MFEWLFCLWTKEQPPTPTGNPLFSQDNLEPNTAEYVLLIRAILYTQMEPSTGREIQAKPDNQEAILLLRHSLMYILCSGCGHMWPDLRKGTLTRFSKCAYFKEAYFGNAMHNLNQTWVFYGGGVAAAMTRKWSLSTAPSGCYGAEFTAFAIEVSFSKNGTSTKVHIFGMEGALDF